MNVYEEVTAFYQSFRGEKKIVGKSVAGRNLYAMRLGNPPYSISQYAIHGREWVTALLALEHIRRGGLRHGVWFLPLMNPDGALLSEVGQRSVPEKFLKDLPPSSDYSLWKANLRGVDLNVNFDARWGTGAKNVFSPAPENYVGEAPFSEPETRALADFTREIAPLSTVSWHTKGEVIYWEFHQTPRKRLRDKKLALVLSESTGYPLATAKGSAGGYKDWCIAKLGIPAFTVEAGGEAFRHPLTRAALPGILAHTIDALAALTARDGEK